MSMIVASALFAAASGLGLILYRRRARARRLRELMEIVSELAPILGPGSELVNIDQRTFQLRVHGAPLALASRDVVKIHLQYRGEQRAWQYRQLIGRAQAQARASSPAEGTAHEPSS
jgi:hypothetical protein